MWFEPGVSGGVWGYGGDGWSTQKVSRWEFTETYILSQSEWKLPGGRDNTFLLAITSTAFSLGLFRFHRIGKDISMDG